MARRKRCPDDPGEAMTDDAELDKKTPIDQAMDMFLYAPLGLAFEARSLLPQLIERGRQQVTMARMVGQFAVTKGQTDATKMFGKLGDQATVVLTEVGLLSRPPEEARPVAPSPTVLPAEPVAPAGSSAPAVRKPSRAAAHNLAIADYDSLAASQVIPRLPGLSAAELEAIRTYESGRRRRKTVLNRIAQLQSA